MARLRTRCPAPARSRGFTVIELMVTVTVLVIGLAVAAPSFRSFLQGQQVKGMAYDLTADLLLARSEALKRNAAVQVRPGEGGWGHGWTTVAAATDERIASRNQDALALPVSGTAVTITFDVNGRVSSPGVPVRITIGGSSASRCVELDLSGRARSRLGGCP